MDTPDVSVIIASHRPALVRDLLNALTAQSVERGRFEVIAVCDYPTVELQRVGAVLYNVNNRSISMKRNHGVRNSRAAIVAFIDDDCIPAPGWVAAGLGYLASHPEAAGVEGFTTIENSAYRPPSLGDYKRLERPGFRTNNIFYRKKIFHDAGAFDERFTVQREDIDCAFSILERGFLIHHSADIRVMHRVRQSEPWDLFKNCINRRFDPLLFKKHPQLYREHIASPFPRSLLMILGFHIVAGCSFCIGLPFFAAAFILDLFAVIALTSRRCGKLSTVWFPEFISCFAGPVVLLCALLYGSIRYRKLLLV